MIRSLIIVIGSAVAVAGCASLPAHQAPPIAAARACPKGAPTVGPDACRPFTRSYSQQDLRQTGWTNLAQALQALDPSVTGGP